MSQVKLSKKAQIKACREFTLTNLNKLRDAIKPFATDEWAIIANGSYARKEATAGSDFDYYILYTDAISGGQIDELKLKVRDAVHRAMGKLPAEGGVFATALKLGALKRNIGGTDDTNE